MKVLLVEDESTTRALLYQILRVRGHDVTACPSGEDGWSAFEGEHHPLVLLNWMLPGMTGLDLARKVRSHPRGQQCVILVITGRTEPGALHSALSAGADDYLAKPVDVGLLNVRLGVAERRVEEIEERHRAEAERRQFEVKMQHAQKLESLGVLAGGIAHDFNNLLVGILGHAGLALMEQHADSPLRRHLERIEHAAMRASELTNQLLAYSGKGRLTVQTVHLNDLVQEMVDLLAVSTTKSAVLRFDLSQDLLPVRADPTQLRQVIMNLITNASDAIGERHGTIRLTTGQTEVTAAQIEAGFQSEDLPPGPYSYIEVADSGCGMDTETLAKIFDPFFTTKTTGRGLGLAAALGIVRGHRGGLTVTSAPRRGTVVRVMLPASQRVERQRPGPGRARVDEGAWRASGAILVMDDEAAVRSVSKGVLEKLGFTVYLAREGSEGLRLFEQHESEIVAVLLDATMPGPGGEHIVHQIRKLRDVPIILCSGYSEAEALSRFEDPGLAGFLQKPYRPATLVSNLRAILKSVTPPAAPRQVEEEETPP